MLVFYLLFLTVHSCLLPPTLHRPFIKTKGGHYRLQRTAIGQLGQDQDHCRRVRLQPIKYRPFPRRKGLPAFFTAIAFLLLTVDLDISFSDLSSCFTLKIGAKYCLWVHRLRSRIWFRNLPVCTMNPFFSNSLSSLAQSRFIGGGYPRIKNPQIPPITGGHSFIQLLTKETKL